MMNKYIVFRFFFILITTSLVFPVAVKSQTGAKVENINFYAEGSNLVITYDIVKAKPDETFDIWFKIVTASGKEINPMTFSGDAEGGISGGKGKKIIWDAVTDQLNLDEAFSVEVFARTENKATETKPDKALPDLNPLPSGSLTAKDVFLPDKNIFTWMGIDFLHVRLRVEHEPDVVRLQYFPAWNKLVLDELDKYNIKKMLKLREIQNDISMITKLNSQADVSMMKAGYAPNYQPGDIAGFVNEYNVAGKSGIGIVFIAEYLDKQRKEGYFHVVALDLTTKQVLMTERMMGEPGGAGFRNYWAGSVYKIILDFEKRYKDFKGKYSK